MIEAIRYNLANLVNFQGRDSRSSFWFYVLFLAIVYFVLAMAMSMVMGGGMVFTAVEHTQVSGPAGTVDKVAIQREMMHGIARYMGASMWVSVALSGLSALLLAASFTRRVHDSGKPGWIAALVLLLYLASLAVTAGTIGEFSTVFDKMDPAHPELMQQSIRATQQHVAARSLFGWIPMIAFLVFGVWPSTDGDNRYGPEPDHL